MIQKRIEQLATEDDRILDLGTGSGKNISHVEGEVIGVDVKVNPMFENVKYVLGDGGQLPFRDSAFDFIFCNQVLEHIVEKERFVAEMERVLKPKGRVLIAFPNRFNVRRSHVEVPFFYSLLPRPIGLVLSDYLLDDASRTWYRDNFAPLSPYRGRRLLEQYFQTVEYRTFDNKLENAGIFSGLTGSEFYNPSTMGKLFIKALPMLIPLFRLPIIGRMAELAYPAVEFECRPGT